MSGYAGGPVVTEIPVVAGRPNLPDVLVRRLRPLGVPLDHRRIRPVLTA